MTDQAKSAAPLAGGPAAGLDDPLTEALLRAGRHLRPGTVSGDLRTLTLRGGREADSFYRDRWSYDKVVRSTHGVNCTGSCSWKVYVKDGIITWETQQTDYPSVGPDSPEYEPRGLPARRRVLLVHLLAHPGALPVRARGAAGDVRARPSAPRGDPVAAWAEIVADPSCDGGTVAARGQGGFVRASWDEAIEIVAAAQVHTIKTYGPDRMAGFSPIPAMSHGQPRRRGPLPSRCSARRCCPSTTGTPTCRWPRRRCSATRPTCPSPADWWNAAYLILWGANLPVTRTPDAHWMTEARYRGQKVVVVSPDYADTRKFADDWLPAAARHRRRAGDGDGSRHPAGVLRRPGDPVPTTTPPVHRPAVPGHAGGAGRRRTLAGKFLTAADLDAGARRAGERRVQDRAARRGHRRAGGARTDRSDSATATPVPGAGTSSSATCARSSPCYGADGAETVACRAAALRRRSGEGAAAPRGAGPARRRAAGHHGVRPAARPATASAATGCPATGPPATTTPRSPARPAWQEEITSSRRRPRPGSAGSSPGNAARLRRPVDDRDGGRDQPLVPLRHHLPRRSSRC
jgi:nitrate reductase alpha subunit